MTKQERFNLIECCIRYVSELEGISIEEVNVSTYISMNDSELLKEADWLLEILDK